MDTTVGRSRVRSWRRLSLAFGLGFFAISVYLGIFPSFAAAQTITVNTLADKADPPFNTLQVSVCGVGTIADLTATVSLREAIIAANNTPGPQTIVFAPGLSGGTINVVNSTIHHLIDCPLPRICDSDTTMNGDINGDGIPDITLDGANLAGVGNGLCINSSRTTVQGLRFKNFAWSVIEIFHAKGSISTASSIDNNTLLNNIVEGGFFSIVIQAGGSRPSGGDPDTGRGGIAKTTVRGNHLSGAGVGIGMFTGDVDGSFLDTINIVGNTIENNSRFGIQLSANGSAAGAHTNITHVNIAQNKVTGSGAVGVMIGPSQGDENVFADIRVHNNDLSNNVLGLLVEGGDSGASGNSLGITINHNTLTHNNNPGGTSGIAVVGGSLSSSDNHVTARMKNNSLTDNIGTGITVIAGEDDSSGNGVQALIQKNTLKKNDGSGIVTWGGLGAFSLSTGTSNDNLLDVQIRKNIVLHHSATGISVIGGVGSLDGRAGAIADNNQVTAKVRNNIVADADHYGIGLAAGGPGLASLNQLTAEVLKNKACNNGITDIQVYGGSLAFASFPANAGTGNVAQVDVTDNTATTIAAADGVAGNSAIVTQARNVPFFLLVSAGS